MTEIKWHRNAVRELESLHQKVAERILDKVEETAKNPQHFLEGLTGERFYKLRVGDYRIVIDWDRKTEILFVLMIDKRGRIYKRMGKDENRFI